jgi:cytochrome c oxidase assembly factor CtaG
MMDTFKIMCLPLAVILLCVALALPAREAANRNVNVARVVLWAAALVLAAIDLFVRLDAIQ